MNITVRGQTQDTLVSYLRQLKRNAYVSPSVNDFVVVYDENSESNLEQLSDLSLQISKDLNCITFLITIYDESIFYYELHENGKLLDEYSSSGVDLFPEGGDTQKLCTVLKRPRSIDRVRPILREPTTEKTYSFASERHKKLVNELGLSVWSTDTIGGYRDIEEAVIDAIIFDEDGFPDVEADIIYAKTHLYIV